MHHEIKVKSLVKWYINYNCDTIVKDAGFGIVVDVKQYKPLKHQMGNKNDCPNPDLFESNSHLALTEIGYSGSEKPINIYSVFSGKFSDSAIETEGVLNFSENDLELI